jgi:hypothetical protein
MHKRFFRQIRMSLRCAAILSISMLALSRVSFAAGEHYAFLVGVNNYQAGVNNLNFAEADVTELRDVLRNSGYQEHNIWTLADSASPRFLFKPTRANVMSLLAKLLQNKSPDDTILVAFSGHGVQFTGDDSAYFCPMDASITSGDMLASKLTLVDLKYVFEQLKACAAGSKVLITDCCRNDPLERIRRDVAGRDLIHSAFNISSFRPKSIAALYSCNAGETAKEDSSLKHGVFFHFVIKTLKDPNQLQDFASFAGRVQKDVMDYAANKWPNDPQTPHFVNDSPRPIYILPQGRPHASQQTAINTPPSVNLISPFLSNLPALPPAQPAPPPGNSLPHLNLPVQNPNVNNQFHQLMEELNLSSAPKVQVMQLKDEQGNTYTMNHHQNNGKDLFILVDAHSAVVNSLRPTQGAQLPAEYRDVREEVVVTPEAIDANGNLTPPVYTMRTRRECVSPASASWSAGIRDWLTYAVYESTFKDHAYTTGSLEFLGKKYTITGGYWVDGK